MSPSWQAALARKSAKDQALAKLGELRPHWREVGEGILAVRAYGGEAPSPAPLPDNQ
jgi:hypothetical protein